MIRVFPRRTNATPDDGQAYVNKVPSPQNLWDEPKGEVHVSCTFTWDIPAAEKQADKWRMLGYDVKLGGPAYDDAGGDFVPGRYLKKGYVITSRGCNNKCWFCLTHKREGSIRELPITDGWNVQDNNLLQCSEKHIRAVFAMLWTDPVHKDWNTFQRLWARPAIIYAKQRI